MHSCIVVHICVVHASKIISQYNMYARMCICMLDFWYAMICWLLTAIIFRVTLQRFAYQSVFSFSVKVHGLTKTDDYCFRLINYFTQNKCQCPCWWWLCLWWFHLFLAFSNNNIMLCDLKKNMLGAQHFTKRRILPRAHVLVYVIMHHMCILP